MSENPERKHLHYLQVDVKNDADFSYKNAQTLPYFLIGDISVRLDYVYNGFSVIFYHLVTPSRRKFLRSNS